MIDNKKIRNLLQIKFKFQRRKINLNLLSCLKYSRDHSGICISAFIFKFCCENQFLIILNVPYIIFTKHKFLISLKNKLKKIQKTLIRQER